MPDQTVNTTDKAAKPAPSPARASAPPAKADPHAGHNMSKADPSKVSPKDPGKK